MGIFDSMKISATALAAQRLRMDVISNNMANQQTTRTPEGGPYQREQIVMQSLSTGGPQFASFMPSEVSATDGKGVAVVAIVKDQTPGVTAYEPNNPDADANGNVTYPNVDVATEMTDMLSATRSYEANTTVFNALKGMALKALEIGK